MYSPKSSKSQKLIKPQLESLIQENEIIKCSKCFHIPFLTLENSNLILECKLGHKEIINIEDYLKNNISYSLNFISCSICNIQKDYKNYYYCFKCQKSFCPIHKFFHKQHDIFSIKKYDSICQIHYKNYIYFCLQCKKNFCRLCFNLHNKHKKIILTSILLTNNDIENYENIIKKIQKKIHESKNKIINKQKNEFIKIIREIHLKLILGKQLLKNYQNEIIQKNICFELIENVKSYFKILQKNIEKTISDFFKLKYSKNQNKRIFEMKNVKSFNNYIESDYGTCLILLNYNDFAFTANDKTIKIYNGDSLENKLNIKVIENIINCITKLKNDKLAITSYEQVEIIQLLNNNRNYCILQRKIQHSDFIFRLIELSNGNLVTCSLDQTIKFWSEIKYNNNNINIKSDNNEKNDFLNLNKINDENFINNNIHIMNINENNGNLINPNNEFNKINNNKKKEENLKPIYQNLLTIFNNNETITKITQISEKELLGLNYQKQILIFYNINTFEEITTIKNIKFFNSICLINSDIFAINSNNKGIYLIKISTHEIIKHISNNSTFTYLFKAKNETIFTGEFFSDSFGEKYEIEQWEINDNGYDWMIISKKEFAHDYYISSIIELNDGSIVSASFDNSIKVWKS